MRHVSDGHFEGYMPIPEPTWIEGLPEDEGDYWFHVRDPRRDTDDPKWKPRHKVMMGYVGRTGNDVLMYVIGGAFRYSKEFAPKTNIRVWHMVAEIPEPPKVEEDGSQDQDSK